MKKPLLFIASLLLGFGLSSQAQIISGPSETFYPDEFRQTRPLREMAPMTEEEQNRELILKESKDRKYRNPNVERVNPDAYPRVGEPIPGMQTEMGTKKGLTIVNNWVGQTGGYTPPDPTGAAGPNHYVQAVNCAYRVYTKTGGAVAGGGPFDLGDLLFGVDDGDPIVMYDKYADRWFISQFGSSGNKIYIAVSTTNDPTGAYNTWQYTSPLFPDYLKFSIWVDGYYMTANTSTQRVMCFERSVMIAGGTSPRMVSATYSPPKPSGFFCPLPADADGALPAAGTPCPIFSYEDDGWGASYHDAVNVFEAAVNWGTTASLTVTGPTELQTPNAFDASYNSTWNDIDQPGTTQYLDGIGGVFTYRAQHRVWTGYNSVVLCAGVKISSSQRSIMWLELRKNTSTNTWSIHQQGTYTPDGLYRWCGSIAMDDNGSIGMAYAVSGISPSNVYPSIRYTGRNAVDPLGQMTYTEQSAIAGTTAITGGNRFGDYSHTCLDPSDGTLFWHTGEYSVSGQKTRIFSFRIPTGLTTGVEGASSEATCTAFQSGNKLRVEASNLPEYKEIVVDLFDINGKKISGQTIVADNHRLETSFDVSQLAAATYLVRIGATNTSFQKVIKVLIH